MKKIILVLMALTYSLFGDCILISSPYTNTEKIVESSFYGQFYSNAYKNNEGKVKYREFSDAYILFVNALSENAKQHCKEKGYNGVYNVKIDHSISETKGYYFTGSVDYVK